MLVMEDSKMKKVSFDKKNYYGQDRRKTIDRRYNSDRRNLVRFESIGCDRREVERRR